MDLSFLRANRFWALVLLALIGVAKALEVIDTEVATILIGSLAGFIGIRTVDRASEKIGGK